MGSLTQFLSVNIPLKDRLHAPPKYRLGYGVEDTLKVSLDQR